MHYNPFAYIRNEKDIISLVNILVINTGNGNKSGEDFWVNAEKLLYMALIGYIYYECVEEEQNFATLLDMINASEVREAGVRHVQNAGNHVRTDFPRHRPQLPALRHPAGRGRLLRSDERSFRVRDEHEHPL